MTEYILYRPTIPPQIGMADLAPRPSALGGKTVGILFNSKVNADIYLERIQELLSARYPDLRYVHQTKPTATWPMSEEALEALRRCDVVVNAFGD